MLYYITLEDCEAYDTFYKYFLKSTQIQLKLWVLYRGWIPALRKFGSKVTYIS